MKPTIDTIFFDFGNVIQAEENTRDLFARFGADYDKRESNAWKKYKIGAYTEWEYYGAILDGTPHENRKNEFTTVLRTMQSITRPHTGFAMLEPLKNNGYRLGIISNHVTEWIRPAMKHLGIEKYFDPLIVSSEVRCAKPNPEIYTIALRQAGRLNAPQNCVFIDDKQRNADAATALGMHGLVFTTLEQLKKDFDVLGVRYEEPRIRGLCFKIGNKLVGPPSYD